MANISTVIIAKNEEDRIARCIKSLEFCDEIIVIDNLSTDNTEKIAKQHGAKVISHGTPDYSAARNLGLENSSSEWILYVDADEVVSEELATEIKKSVSRNSDFSAFRIQRQNFYLGDNPWPKIEKFERLFRKKTLKGWYGKVHESPKVNGEIGDISGLLYHYTHRTIEEMVEKTLVWSRIEAELRHNARHPEVVWWRFPRVMATAFFNSYISQGGWKVGIVGIIESIYQAFSAYITYARLWELQKVKEANEKS